MGLALSPRAGVCLAVLRARLPRTRLLSRCSPRPATPDAALVSLSSAPGLPRTRRLSRCPPRPAAPDAASVSLSSAPGSPGRCSSDPAPAPCFGARSPYYITPPARYARGARRGRRRYCPTSPPHYAIGCDGQFRPNLASPRLARAPFLSAPAHIVNAAPLQSYPFSPRPRRRSGDEIPAYAGMTGGGGAAPFRGRDGGAGELGRRGAPRLWRWGAEWIPAYAGMTGRERAPSAVPSPAAFAAPSPSF